MLCANCVFHKTKTKDLAIGLLNQTTKFRFRCERYKINRTINIEIMRRWKYCSYSPNPKYIGPKINL